MGKNEKVSQGPFCRWRRSRRLGIATSLLLTTNRLHRWHDTIFGDLVLILAAVVVARLVKRLPSPEVRGTCPISDISEIFSTNCH